MNRNKISDYRKPKGTRFSYYVLWSKHNGFPKITVAVGSIPESGGKAVHCRGMALCSRSEIREEVGFKEDYGRDLARRRMFKAFNAKKDSGPILREEAIDVINTVRLGTKSKFFTNKSAYKIRLTDTEKELLRR